MSSPQQVLDFARAEIGYQESPAGSNHTKFGVAFGLDHQPWCVIYLWFIFNEAHMTLPDKTASVYQLLSAFKAAHRWYPTPEVGDIVFWSYGEGHVEIVESIDTKARILTTIGGNTSAHDGSKDNGGEVARNRRAWNSQCLGFGRPNYSPDTPTPTPQPSEDDMHDSARTVRWPDGSTIEVTFDGAMQAAGCTVWGSFYDLSPAARQNVPNPPNPYSLRPARTVPVVYKDPSGNNVIVDTPDKNGGVIASIVGKDGKVNEFKFDAEFLAGHH